MGNHEYCSGCGASDFHFGYTCEQAYPEGRARKLKEAAEREHQRTLDNAAVEEMVKRLRRLNIPAEIKRCTTVLDDHAIYFDVEILGRNLTGNRRKAMRDTDPKVQARRSKAYHKKYGDGW